MGITTIRGYCSVPLSKGDFSVLIPIIVGLLLYATLSKKYLWISRWPTALMVGTATGLAVRGFLATFVFGQIIGTIGFATIAKDPLTTINNALMIILTICTFAYFLFTIPARGLLKVTNRVGRAAMMVAFGAVIGYRLLSSMAQVMQRLIFLLVYWLGLA
jgi:hypothetical protein